MPTAIYDDFDNAFGQLPGYDTYDANQLAQLGVQRHVDIRCFEQRTVYAPYTMFDLDVLTEADIDALTQQQLESKAARQQAEIWVDGAGTSLASSIGPQSDRAYFNGLSLTCRAGSTSATSAIVSSNTSPGLNLAGFAPTDTLSVTLPAFPASSLTLSSCFLDISSDVAFSAPLTDSLALTGLTTGDQQATFALSQLTHADISNIRAVRFRIVATATCAFRCLAIRLLATSWKFAQVDVNTLYGRLCATVPPSGSLSEVHTFPAAASPVTPSDWPILLFNDGDEGPRLVNGDLGLFIDTGANSAANSISLYLREAPLIPQTYSQLDGTLMSALDGHPQPDFAAGSFDNFTDALYQTVTIAWGTTNHVEFVADAAAASYTLPVSFNTFSTYYARTLLEDETLRVIIYPVNNGVVNFDEPVFDSGLLIAFANRRRGRLGWYAHLAEGNTYIRRLRPRRLMFGEYRSAPLASITPVIGARLYAGTSPPIDLFPLPSNVGGLGYNSIVGYNTTKSASGKCLQVQCSGTLPLQGLSTSSIRFQDFADTEISFSVNAPASAGLVALLRSTEAAEPVGSTPERAVAVLPLPPLTDHQWTAVTVPLDGLDLLPGNFELLIVQTNTIAAVWWIDQLAINQRSVSWEGRSQAADPWEISDPPWIAFGDQLDDPYNAALLGTGTALQIRGQVVQEGGAIAGVQILPQYKQLGRFIWPEDEPVYSSPPSPSFTITERADGFVLLDGSASTAAHGINAYRWQLGDGTGGYGETLRHQYLATGQYVITLTVVDLLGQAVSITHQINVIDVGAAVVLVSGPTPVAP